MAYSHSSFSHIRSSCSLPNLLLYSLGLLLFTLSSASLAPILLARSPPASFGWALLAVSAASLLSSLLALFSHAARLCFIAHAATAASTIIGQCLALLALLLQPEPCLELLKPATGLRKARILMKIEAGVLAGMLVVQAATFVSACVVQRWWEREHVEVEKAKKVAARRRRSRRVAVEREEAFVNSAADAEGREMEERI
ncbi:hypothetical protein KSP39_PZI010129 [Platanthera zijinensis]|uniref:Uncharacterized protein n=1 Tax=Platanthera zijinensis TaxID=2320716 RepID=A0AAP0BJT6_9ASPA